MFILRKFGSTYIVKTIKKHILRTRSIEKRLAGYFMAVLIILFLLNLLLYYREIGNYYIEEVETRDQVQLQKIAREYDSILDKTEVTIFHTVNNNNGLINLVKNYEKTVEHKTLLREAITRFILEEYISSVYLYIPEANEVLTTDFGIMDYDSFYDFVPFQQLSKGNFSVLSPRNVSYRNRKWYIISIACKIPLDSNYYNGILIVNIDSNKLYNKITAEHQLIEGCKVYVMDKNLKIVLSDDSNLTGKSIFDHMGWKEDFIPLEKTYSIITSEYHISGLYSEQNELNFMLYQDVDNFAGNKKPYELINYIIYSIFLILLAAGIIYFKANKVFKPLRKMIQKMNREDNKSVKTNDEIKTIENYVGKINDENDELKENVKKMFPFYREKLLFDIMVNDYYSLSEIRSKLNYLNIRISLQNYIVLSVMIDFIHMEEHEISTTKMRITKLVSLLLDKEYSGFCITSQRDIISIGLSIPDNFVKENTHEYVLEFSYIIENMIKKIIKNDFFIGIGYIVNSIDKLNKSYRGSIEVLDYRKNSKNNIIPIWNVQKKSGSEVPKYPYEKEKELISYIKLGYCKESMDALDSIFIELKNNKYLSDREIEYVLLQVIASINKLVLNNQIAMEDNNFTQMLLNLVQNNNLNKIQDSLKDFIKKVTEEINNTDINDYSNIKRIINFIDEHYTENYQLSEIGEKFGLNRFYVGQLIKEHTGKSYNDYINIKKINKAKVLLRNSNMSVSEIANITGYNYSYYFIRIFKQIEGMTPGEYKKSEKTCSNVD